MARSGIVWRAEAGEPIWLAAIDTADRAAELPRMEATGGHDAGEEFKFAFDSPLEGRVRSEPVSEN